MPGFVPTRQLVLVDLLSLLLGVRPGERAVVAVDGADSSGRARLVAELAALAPHVAGRELVLCPFPGDDSLLADTVRSFREGHLALDEEAPAPDAVLVVEGARLRRAELARCWDATCLVTSAQGGYGPADLDYVRQARLLAPTWMVDLTDAARPELIEPDPDEPQWFDQV